jgi:hypothetical protein
MLKKLEYICVVASIALIGADRIDLLANHASFKLTPFLVFASLALILRFLLMLTEGNFHFTIPPPIRRQEPFIVALVLFLFLSSFSTLFGLDPERGVMALGDLILVSILGYYVSVRVLGDPAPEKLIFRAVSYALLVYLGFCIVESVLWSKGVTLSQTSESFVQTTFAPATLFWAPRLSGPIPDPNRSGFVLVMYLALLDRFDAKFPLAGVLRFAIAVFIFLTVSRSAILCWFVYYLFSEILWKHFASRRRVAWLLAFVIGCSLTFVAYQTEISNLLNVWELSDVLSERVSGEEGTSGGEHIKLIERGLQTWSTSAHTVVAGIGLASAPKVLTDFFGDYKYGNFHCLYVTALAELGLPAFLVLLVLLGYPLIGRRGAASCIAAIIVYNIPYQSHMEPVFWFVLAIVWSYDAKERTLGTPHLQNR